MNTILEVKNLSISFNNEQVVQGENGAVKNVSFSVGRGEVFAIVGESGSGKTVLCKSLLKLLPKSAAVRVDSILYEDMGGNKIDIPQLNEREMQQLRKNKFSIVFQNPMTALNPSMPIGKQIEEAVIAREGKTAKIDGKKTRRELRARVRARVVELMEQVGLSEGEEIYNSLPHHLSGGMRQRVVMAIALAGRPKVLLADEPTSALDVTIQAQFLELFKELTQNTGLTIILVTHDFGVVAKVADRVAVMKKGEFVEVGTTDNVLKNPTHSYTKELLASLPANLQYKGELQ